MDQNQKEAESQEKSGACELRGQGTEGRARSRFRDSVGRLWRRFNGTPGKTGGAEISREPNDGKPRSQPEVRPAVGANAKDIPNQTSRCDSKEALATSANGKTREDSQDPACPLLPGISHQSVDGDDASDLWSAAFREAVEDLGEDVNAALFKGKSVEELFRGLLQSDNAAAQESTFIRGVKHLESVQVPLQRFKLAIDLASPLTALEPTTSTVFGVVRSVTAIAISLAGADMQFAKQIGEMLEHLSYIDDCDTLGRKSDNKDIHKALVSIYRKILEFYQIALDILTRRGAKLIARIALRQDQLHGVIQDFLRYAEMLRSVVQKATLEIVEEIKVMLYDQEIASWLGSDKIIHQSRYHAELRDLRADQACEFLLMTPEFIEFYQSSKVGQLAILGDMGCGKSVATAYFVDELMQRSEHQLPRPRVCYCFCRNDGSGQADHIFSVLILALLNQLTGLKKTFHYWYTANQAAGRLAPATDKAQLAEFLKQALASIDRPIYIVIDGLDECDRQSRNSLLSLLNDLCWQNPRVKVILSSRPEAEILEQIGVYSKVYLRSNTERDHLIATHAVHRRLHYLDKNAQQLIIDKVSSSAKGSAIWIRMMVEIIERRGIRAHGPMVDFLESTAVPQQLSELYVTLLSRCTFEEPENMLIASTALQILAMARRPLTISELGWAVAMAMAPQSVSTVSTLAHYVDARRVLDLIRPFVSAVDFADFAKRQVRLVHQSVKEFILAQHSKKLPHTDGQHLESQSHPASQSGYIQHMESFMAKICIRYLLLDEIGQRDLFTPEQMAIDILPQETNIFSEDAEWREYTEDCSWEEWETNMIRYDPTERGFGEFFVYASCHWLDHLGTIRDSNLLPLPQVEILCQAGSTRLNNWTEQIRRPGCVMQARFGFDSSLYDPLSITALYGSEDVLRYMVDRTEWDPRYYLPQTAERTVEQILRWGDVARLVILHEGVGTGPDLDELDFMRAVLHRWADPTARERHWNPVFDLITSVLETSQEDYLPIEVLCRAAKLNCMPLLERLLETAKRNESFRDKLFRGSRQELDVSDSDKHRHLSVGEAVIGDHVNAVQLLLAQESIGPHLRYVNSNGENVLHLASLHCNSAILTLLMDRCQELSNQLDREGHTPLERVILSPREPGKRYTSASILLSHSSEPDQLKRALRTAVDMGDLEMCSILLEIGRADPLIVLQVNDGGELELKDHLAADADNQPAVLHLLRSSVESSSAVPGQTR